MKRYWMVRSDAGRLYEDFKTKSGVAIGWECAGKIEAGIPRASIEELLKTNCGYTKQLSAMVAAAQVWKFLNEIKVGEGVVTYDPSTRMYLVGHFSGAPEFDPNIFGEDVPRVRKTHWNKEVERSRLSVKSRNSLGSTLTVFQVPHYVVAEIQAIIDGSSPAISDEVDSEDHVDAFADLDVKALELIKDAVSNLDWEDMQLLIAGLLRAVGYRTRVSPLGPDRGKDIVASPDGFGFENPRIVVEVKHRAGTMGAKEVRSFLGGRHKDDKGLFVSTGGFTKDAFYEAERASIPLTLWDLSDVVRTLVERYESLDLDTKRLVPLRRLYWPG